MLIFTYYAMNRDEPILLFISPILFRQFFFLTYYAQYFAPSYNIFLKV